ncbi:hypothetical protein [Tabrizicola aquatica]|uniref:hypothetical protein n=1 Tax=Tabrizicola aquatica TaxID=909926 RepID=UPI0011AF43B5|nr:hypothetical protein [Tabrizicola aquatica]
MLRSLARAWRRRAVQADLTRLANRLGPHLARDIGIEGTWRPLPCRSCAASDGEASDAPRA